MKLSFLLLIISLFFIQSKSIAQSDYITLNDKQYTILERLDMKLINDSVLRFTTVKPFNRVRVTQRLELIDSMIKQGSFPSLNLSAVDKFNIKELLQSNADVTSKEQPLVKHKKVLGLYEINQHAYFTRQNKYTLVVDPVLSFGGGYSSSLKEPQFINTRGVLMRGTIDNKISFYSYLSDNQERDPQYVTNFVNKNRVALPGQGFFKINKADAFDYFNARAGISFNLGKYFDLGFAYDKLYIGNGYRSLFLSDFSSCYPFVRFVTHFGKLSYETILAQTVGVNNNKLNRTHDPVPVNYLSIHHISMQITKRLNIGLYENVMENGKGGLKVGYLNPVIFYKSIEQDYGIAGKTNIGIDFKENAFNNFQIYGQLLINEFRFSDVTNYGKGAFTNKQAIQIGIKYNDAFSVKNLDVQLETNIVRPYTYMNFDSTTNFTNYNQPLAHPLGANFREFIAIVKMQPIPKLTLLGKLFYYEQGLDLNGVNYGSNLLLTYNTRPSNYGFFIGSGKLVKCAISSLNIAYELSPNFFIESNFNYRNYNVVDLPQNNEFIYMLGIRWNISRRDFEF